MNISKVGLVVLAAFWSAALAADISCDADDELCGTALPGSVCTNGTCQCPDHFILNSLMTECIPVVNGTYYAPCVDGMQCVHNMDIGAVCVQGKCVCQTGYHFLWGKCWKSIGLGKKCSDENNCYTSHSSDTITCTLDKVCSCSEIAYIRGPNLSCRRKADLGEPCALDSDCKAVNSSAVCNEMYICALVGSDTADKIENVEVDGYSFAKEDIPPPPCCPGCFWGTDGVCRPELGTYCRHRDNCTHFDNADCLPISVNNSACTCKAGYTHAANNRQCIKTLLFGSKCTMDEECADYGDGAACRDSYCGCLDGYHWVDTEKICWPSTALGGACDSSEPCWGGSQGTADCIDSICKCAPEYHQVGDVCRFNATEIGMECVEDIDCFVPNSVCTDSKCACGAGYHLQEGTKDICEVSLEGPCTSDEACQHLNNALCVEATCQCTDKYTSNSEHTVCLLLASEVEDPCEEIQQCTEAFGQLAVCSDDGHCRCSAESHFDSNKCWANAYLGDACPVGPECYVDDHPDRVECRNSSCECKDGYVASDNRMHCVSVLDGPCSVAEDCQHINNSVCVDVCTCPDMYIPNSDYSACLLTLEGPCTADEDCLHLNNSVCDGVCTCAVEYTSNSEQTACLLMASEFEDPCEDVEQCVVPFGPLAVCSDDGYCRCTKESHFDSKKCWANAYLDEACHQPQECYLDDHPDRVECLNGNCKCKLGYFANEDGRHCDSAASLKINAVLLMLVMAVSKFCC